VGTTIIEELSNPPSEVPANAASYEEECARFSWEAERCRLDGLPNGRGLNLAYEAVDRHAFGLLADHVALRHIGKRGDVTDLTYAELARRTSRFARVLDHLRVGPGERVFVLLPRVPELYVAVLGTLKHRSVACTLFSAFGPEPIRQRMTLGSARVLVTSSALYRRKVAPIRDGLPELEHVVVIGDDVPEGGLAFAELMAAASDDYEIPATDPEDPALLHFTSGTTGTP
jgi:acetyl-CoA synthetase